MPGGQPPDDRPIFLVGFMGSGKSTVGAGLAAALDWDLVDTDALVERREGRSIESIFRDSGESRFRGAEWEALRTLEGRRRVVVACGGGLVLGYAQRRWIRQRGRTIWLDVPLEGCRRRLAAGAGRPLWSTEDPVAQRAMFESRRAVYALADLRIEAFPADVEGVVGAILAALA